MDDEIRQQQAQFTVEYMEEVGSGRLRFLTGDMNTTDDTEAYNTFIQAGLVDTYLELHGDETAATGNTVPIILAEGAEQDPRRRIDFVLAGPPVGEGAIVEPTASIICFGNHDEAGFYPSDHLGVMTTLDLVVPYRD
jgi:endonuclease/exonuclease/phosphatase family metal-dependent hydrolase